MAPRSNPPGTARRLPLLPCAPDTPGLRPCRHRVPGCDLTLGGPEIEPPTLRGHSGKGLPLPGRGVHGVRCSPALPPPPPLSGRRSSSLPTCSSSRPCTNSVYKYFFSNMQLRKFLSESVACLRTPSGRHLEAQGHSADTAQFITFPFTGCSGCQMFDSFGVT